MWVTTLSSLGLIVDNETIVMLYSVPACRSNTTKFCSVFPELKTLLLLINIPSARTTKIDDKKTSVSTVHARAMEVDVVSRISTSGDRGSTVHQLISFSTLILKLSGFLVI